MPRTIYLILCSFVLPIFVTLGTTQLDSDDRLDPEQHVSWHYLHREETAPRYPGWILPELLPVDEDDEDYEGRLDASHAFGECASAAYDAA
jgi:hypothetical protein